MKNVTNYIAVFIACAIYGQCNFEPPMDMLISAEEITHKVKETGKQISKDYEGKDLSIVMIMKGAICVTSDLMREIDIPCTLHYISASSYGQNGTVAGQLTIQGIERLDLAGKDVLVIDDIFETGRTIGQVCKELEKKGPKSIKTLVLLYKQIERTSSYRPEYVLFEIPDRFVIGYGLDYKELYRGIPHICAFIDDKPPF